MQIFLFFFRYFLHNSKKSSTFAQFFLNMKRAHRIVLLVIVIVAAIGIVAYGGLSAVLSRPAT